MSSPEPRAVFEAFVRALNSGDTAALGELGHRDFTETCRPIARRDRSARHTQGLRA
jgi:hypothetical protein